MTPWPGKSVQGGVRGRGLESRLQAAHSGVS